MYMKYICCVYFEHVIFCLNVYLPLSLISNFIRSTMNVRLKKSISQTRKVKVR